MSLCVSEHFHIWWIVERNFLSQNKDVFVMYGDKTRAISFTR